MTRRERSMGRPSPHEVVQHLDTLCKSETMMRSARGKEILRYLTSAVLREEPEASFKGTVIGTEVFGLAPDHDPHTDPIVRVSIRELRKKLTTYYETEGRQQPIRILIPLGSYVPTIHYDSYVALSKISDRAAVYVANAKAAFDKRTIPGHEMAFKYLNLALRDHPEHPRLISLKAMVHAARAMYGRYPRTELEAAEVLVEEAKRHDEIPWERPVVEAWLKMTLHFDWEGADALFSQALLLSHGESRYNTWYTAFLGSQLRIDEAVTIHMEAVSHSAHDSASRRGDLAQAQMVSGNYDDAEETLRMTLELFPKEHYLPYLHLALLREARNDFAGAVRAIEQLPITASESTIAIGIRGLLMGLAGDNKNARRIYAELLALRGAGERFVPAVQLACAALGVQDSDSAALWFNEAAINERDPTMNWVPIYPLSRHLRHHSGFRALIMDSMKLRFPG